MVYFRTYAQSIGCDVDSLGDLAVWNYIIRWQAMQSAVELLGDCDGRNYIGV